MVLYTQIATEVVKNEKRDTWLICLESYQNFRMLLADTTGTLFEAYRCLKTFLPLNNNKCEMKL